MNYKATNPNWAAQLVAAKNAIDTSLLQRGLIVSKVYRPSPPADFRRSIFEDPYPLWLFCLIPDENSDRVAEILQDITDDPNRYSGYKLSLVCWEKTVFDALVANLKDAPDQVALSVILINEEVICEALLNHPETPSLFTRPIVNPDAEPFDGWDEDEDDDEDEEDLDFLD